MSPLDRITVDQSVRFGKPCERGTRITVGDVLSYLAAGMTEDEIVAESPQLSREDIRACLAYAAERERRSVGLPTAWSPMRVLFDDVRHARDRPSRPGILTSAGRMPGDQAVPGESCLEPQARAEERTPRRHPRDVLAERLRLPSRPPGPDCGWRPGC